MGETITSEQFLLSIQEYETILEENYLKEIEKSKDKSYGANHFQLILFRENEMVPYPSILFNQLKTTFEHYSKLLGQEYAYEQAFSMIQQIREYSQAELNMIKEFLKAGVQPKLPVIYKEYIEQDKFILNELIQIEEAVQDFTNENLAGALAIHTAGFNLLEKYQEDEIGQEEIPDKNGNYTLNERLLALHFLLASLGFKKGLNEDRTALASLYHLIMDKNFNESTKIKNSNIYKSLGIAPEVVKDRKKLNNYLQNIRPYFEKANMTDALKLIDQNIQNED